MERDDRLFILVGFCVAMVVGGIALVLWYAQNISITAPASSRIEVAAIQQAEPVSAPSDVRPAANLQPDEVSLGDADEAVRRLAAGLSSHPRLLSWLVTDGVTRRFVASVEAVAEGYSPRDELDFLRPHQAFIVREHEDGYVIAAGSYRRYNLAAEVLDSIDADDAVALYRQLEPMIDDAHSEISWTGAGFEERLRAAVDHLLEVEVPEGVIEVERRTLSYAYADYELERLTDAQRHLLRMGPWNARKVQAKLAEIRGAFGWPMAVPSPAVTAEFEEAGPSPEPRQIAELEEIECEPTADEDGIDASMVVAALAPELVIATKPGDLDTEESVESDVPATAIETAAGVTGP